METKIRAIAGAAMALPLALLIACSPAEASGRRDAGMPSPAASAEAALIGLPSSLPAPHPLSMEALSKRSWSSSPAPVVIKDLGLVRGARTKILEYQSEGNTLRALLQTPNREPPPGGFPVVLMAHGHVPPSAWSTETSYIFPSSGYAARGYLVLKPDYRGHGSSGGTAEGMFRTIDYTVDVLELLAKIPSIPGADPKRIYLYGHSMGGEVALRVLALTDSIKAASLWAAVTQPFPENTLHYQRKRDPAAAELALERIKAIIPESEFAGMSPLSRLDRVREPLIVHHGTADDSVPYAWAAPFQSRLDAAGVSYRFYSYEGEDHNISRSFNRVLDRDASFFAAAP